MLDLIYHFLVFNRGVLVSIQDLITFLAGKLVFAIRALSKSLLPKKNMFPAAVIKYDGRYFRSINKSFHNDWDM